MLKNILTLKGVQKLEKSKQVFINGGVSGGCESNSDCFMGRICHNDRCIRPECYSDSDCPPGFLCWDYECHC